jgi:RNA polymerase sigma-70 factor (sigma-E family)
VTFSDYVTIHQRRLLRFATALTADPRLAEDVLQDVLARAFVRWDKIAQLEQPHAYIRRMVVNEYLSWRRRWARVEPRALVEPDGVVVDHATAHSERAALIAEIGKLSAKHRTVLVLRFFEHMTDSEIGQLLDCSPATVRSYASRALAKLRVQIAAEPSSPPVVMSVVTRETS